jgi:hypothetical protein
LNPAIVPGFFVPDGFVQLVRIPPFEGEEPDFCKGHPIGKIFTGTKDFTLPVD